VSGLSTKFLGAGRNLARISQTYNSLIYQCLQEMIRKIRLFSIKWGRKAQLSGQPKTIKPLSSLRGNLPINSPSQATFYAFYLRFGAKCVAKASVLVNTFLWLQMQI
jgi:hypothetical protein